MNRQGTPLIVFSRLNLRLIPVLGLLLFPMFCCGCGTMLSQSATEHLLLSDAVDRSIEDIDFGTLSGEKVYFDAQYIRAVKGIGFVNSDYFISSLRQQMVAANCLLQDKKEDADFVVEARVGVLGTNSHDVTYGLPQNNSVTNVLNTAAAVMPTMPAVPPLPELSLAKKHSQMSAAKVALFAYNVKTRQPVWQSGNSAASSRASDTWVLGAGPFQRGDIYKDRKFRASKVRLYWPWRKKPKPSTIPVKYTDKHVFLRSDKTPKPVQPETLPAKKDEPKAGKSVAAKPIEKEQKDDKKGKAASRRKLSSSVPNDQKLLWEGPELLIEREAAAKKDASATSKK
jgi:hypothetical protein